MRKNFLSVVAALLVPIAAAAQAGSEASPTFVVTLPQGDSTAVDGRLLIVVSKDLTGEPRFKVNLGLDTQQVFGVDVEGWKPGAPVVVGAEATGYPLHAMIDLGPGTYNVQAVLHVYETFRRADGRVLKLPMDNGEGQQWNQSPGNLYSKPKQVRITAGAAVPLELSETIPPIPPPIDTKYVRHVRIESKLLTKFWGRPMHLGAIVIVPPGFDDGDQRYPIAFEQGHFAIDFGRFRETPPPTDMPVAQRRRAEANHRFFQEWTAGRLPKILLARIQHPTPYYDDSYGVNTANMGPYGDALTQELYPYIEKQFRGIGEPWARILYGGSTGGWTTLAQQILYPDYFGGAWGFCPDSVDFHAFSVVNIYSDQNGHFDVGPFAKEPKPIARSVPGQILLTMENFTRLELALGTKGRSGGQMDAFHATFGPVGPDGYPAKLWDPRTGEIDRAVASYWQEHFDLTARLKRDWAQIGPKLVGKLHVTMGTKDTYYLDTAVRLLEEFLESTKRPEKGPYYGGSVEYGNNEPHCWTGQIAPGETIETHYLPIFADHIRQLAPTGADVTSWNR